MTLTLIKMFTLLVLCHQLADQPFQTDFICRVKRGQVPGIPAWVGLLYHSFMHAALVLLVTDYLTLAVIELLCHWSIDRAKIAGCFGNLTDQCLYIGCKVVYILIIWSIL